MTSRLHSSPLKSSAAALLRRLRDDERGMQLVEVIMAATMMIVVLSASLLTFELLLNNQRTATTRFDSQDRVRVALDRLARNLRNVSGATTGATEIDQASAYDLIFRTVNPQGPSTGTNPTNIERVRYCVDASNPANERLWVQVQPIANSSTNQFSAPTGGCPDYTWATQANSSVYADSITNEIGGQNRPAFSYTTSNGAVVMVHSNLYVNANPSGAAAETNLSSGVFLRNQDVPPTASFTATPGAGYITLDGSASFDPQGTPLTFVWYDNGVKIACGNGVGITCSDVGLTSNSSHTIQLKVFDPAGVEGDAPSQTVTVK